MAVALRSEQSDDLTRQFSAYGAAITALLSQLATEKSPRKRRQLLVELDRLVQQATPHLKAEVDSWIEDALPGVYAVTSVSVAKRLGTKVSRDLKSRADVVSLQGDARNGFDDAFNSVSKTSGRLSRSSGKALERNLFGSTPFITSDELRTSKAHNAVGVVYRNGARHGIGDYTEMLIRTIVARAVNLATVRIAASQRVEYFEVFDGKGCGWRSHSDSDYASGKIVSAEEALAYPLAHPRCQRALDPRPDIIGADQAAEIEIQTKHEAEQLAENDVTRQGASLIDQRLNARSQRVYTTRAKIREQ